MTSESTTRWPLLEERVPFAGTTARADPQRRIRSSWLLIALAFICGGLVSAAGFSIGWRHQAQHDSAAQAALAAATARTHALDARVGALRASLAAARRAEARATAAKRAVVGAGAGVAGEAARTHSVASSISSGSSSLTGAVSRIASELKTLDTYLTTTPAGQLDPGYVASQAAYLDRQLTKLQTDAGNLGGSVTSFEAAVRKLTRDAAALKQK